MTSRSRLLVLGVWGGVLLSGALILFAFGRVSLDMAAFLPAEDTPTKQLLLGQLREGPAARLILLAIEGGRESTLSAASQRFAATLRADARFPRVINGSRQHSAQDLAWLAQRRYLLDSRIGTDAFSVSALRQVLQEQLRALASPLGAITKQTLASDPTGAVGAVLHTWAGRHAVRVVDGVWLSRDGKRALLMAEVAGGSLDLARQEEVMHALHDAFTRINEDAALRMHATGPIAFAVRSSHTIRGETRLISAAATVVVIGLLWLVFRSLYLVVVNVLPVLAGLLVAAALVSVVFGSVHGITLAFGATLLGVAVDYPIHTLAHAHGGEPLVNTTRRIWSTLAVGALTTSLGYLVMATTELAGLQQVGLFAGVGLLVAVAATRWLVPAVLPQEWQPRYDFARFVRPLRWVERARAARIAVLGVGAASVLALALWPGERFADDPSALSVLSQQELALDRALRAELGAPEVRHVFVVRAPRQEDALRSAEELGRRLDEWIASGLVQGYESPARFLPSTRTQEQRRAALPDAETLRAALLSASDGLPYKPGVFEPFVRDVDQARSGELITYSEVSNTDFGLRLQGLLREQGGQWVALLPLNGVSEASAVGVAARALEDEQVHYLDLRRETTAIMAGFRSEGLSRMGWGLALMAGVLALSLRRFNRWLAVAAPVALALVTALAVVLLAGQLLTLFHLVAALLVAGITLDYSLFIGRSSDVEDMRRRTAWAVMVCALSTGSMFAILAASTIPVLHAIGSTVAVGVAAGMIGSMALAPRNLLDRT